MGYNNNHAGMHMIWYRHYGEYDDLDYYDRIAEMNTRKKAKQTPLVKNEDASAIFETIKNNVVSEEKVVKSQKNTMVQNSQPAPSKKNNMNKPHGFEIKVPEFGKEQIIDIEYFVGLPETVMANMMMIAIKNKKDIYEILVECEDKMKKDKRTNPDPKSDWSKMPKLMPAIIFLSLVADKLDCAVYELFIDDFKRREKFVYGIIDYVRDYMHSVKYSIWDYGEVAQSGAAYFGIGDFDLAYGMVGTDKVRYPISAGMSLEFVKDVFDNGEVNYAISFGNLTIYNYSKYDYSLKGAYLLEESEGKLKDFIEEMIANHPEWIEEE